MGVYIPNMEKRKAFNDYCPLESQEDGSCQYWENEYRYCGGNILDDCPLIEIDLVRCGECKWCEDRGTQKALKCTNPYIDMDIHPLCFCSYGERRANETT